MAEPGPGHSWWTTLPGVLTGVAALLTAVTALLVALLPLVRERAEPGPTNASRSAGVPTVSPAPAPPAPVPPARRDGATGGQEARHSGAEPRSTVPVGSANPAEPNRLSGVPPLVRREPLDIAGTSFEVLDVGSSSPRSGERSA